MGNTHDPKLDRALEAIAKAFKGLAFGEIHITVHDSQAVRIERIERIRLETTTESSVTKGGDRKI